MAEAIMGARTTATGKYLVTLVLLTLVYVAAGKLGLMFAFMSVNATPLWPPTGLALAAVLLLGPRIWPAIFAGAFLVSRTQTTIDSAAMSLGIATGDTVEALIGAYLTNRFAGGRRAFDRAEDVFTFAVLTALCSTMISATIGVTTLALGGYATKEIYGVFWLAWWLGNVQGNLIVAPVLLLWIGKRSRAWNRALRWEAVLLGLLVVLVGQALFGGWWTIHDKTLPISSLGVPLLVWTAVRFGPRETAAATLLLSGLAIWGTMHGSGPFAGASPNQSLLLLHVFMSGVGLTAMALAAAVWERQQAQRNLEQAHEELQERVNDRTAELSAALRRVECEIGEREQAAQASLQSEERFRIVSRATNDAVWDWDLATNHIIWNEGMLTLFGYSPQDVEMDLDWWYEHVHLDDRQRIMNRRHSVLHDGGQSLIEEYRYRRADGSYAYVLGRGHVLRDADGKPVRMIGAMMDMTARKELEDQLGQSQKMEAVGRLAAGVAHDFNNILTVINGYSDLLQTHIGKDGSMHEDLQAIRTAGQRGALLVRQLLAFGRKQVLAPQVLDLNDVIEHLEPLLRPLIGEGVNLVVNLNATCGSVSADVVQMEQVIINLAVNARDAMGQGGRLTIETRNVEVKTPIRSGSSAVSPGYYVVVTITDTGHGMDAPTMARIFEPFFTTKAVGQGTGLGLATVYGILTQSGGQILVSSQPGQGTTFDVYLPSVTAESGDSRRDT
ncbi:MAG: MASE1 domain-containing protein, partial [Nitrospiraceae bacterium]